MRNSISEQARSGILLAAVVSLLGNSNITQKDIEAKYADLKEKGILK